MATSPASTLVFDIKNKEENVFFPISDAYPRLGWVKVKNTPQGKDRAPQGIKIGKKAHSIFFLIGAGFCDVAKHNTGNYSMHLCKYMELDL